MNNLKVQWNMPLRWNIITLALIMTLLLGCSLGTGSRDVLTADVYFNESADLVIQIPTGRTPDFTFANRLGRSHRIHIQNVKASTLVLSSSLLWDFTPLEIRSEITQTGYAFLLNVQSTGEYTIDAEANSDGLNLTISGEAARSSWEKVINYATMNYDSLDQEERQMAQEVITATAFSPSDGFILGQLNMARKQEQYDWHQMLYSRTMHREPLSLSELEWLGNYFERHQENLLANHTWYEYYRMTTVSEATQYTDNIPAKVTEGEVQQSQGTMATQRSAQGTGSSGGIPWYLLMIPVLVLGGYFIWKSRNDISMFRGLNLQTKAAQKETDQFQQFLDEINAQLQEEKPEAAITRGREENPDEQESFTPEKPTVQGEKQTVAEGKTEPFDSTEIENQKPAEEEQGAPASKQSGKSRIMLKQAEVMELYKSNMEPEMIARNLHMSRGEVELLIRISKEKSRKPNQSVRKKKISLDMLSEESIRELSHKMQISEEEAKIMRLRKSGS